MLSLRQAVTLGTWSAIIALLLALPAIVLVAFGSSIGDISDSTLISKLWLLLVAGVIGLVGGLITSRNNKLGGGLLAAGGVVGFIGLNIFSIIMGGIMFVSGVSIFVKSNGSVNEQTMTGQRRVVPMGCIIALGLAIAFSILLVVTTGPRVGTVFSKVTSGLTR